MKLRLFLCVIASATYHVQGQDATNKCDSIISSAPDPSTKCCGIDAAAGSKIIGGTTPSIDAYPWTVLLEYIKGGKTQLLCGGTLITNRYILTAAHCVNNKAAKTPVNVRVGEFDTRTDGPDCITVEDAFDCTEGAISIPIDTIITHPNYTQFNNDIAIIKLKEPVKYSDFVRPICLPTSEPAYTEEHAVAGWGRVNTTKRNSDQKQHAFLQLFKTEDCQKKYGSKTTLTDKQVCAGDDRGADTCIATGGYPLMRAVDSPQIHYEVTGLVSFGPRQCGTPDLPGVYTNVYPYLDWIRQNIK